MTDTPTDIDRVQRLTAKVFYGVQRAGQSAQHVADPALGDRVDQALSAVLLLTTAAGFGVHARTTP